MSTLKTHNLQSPDAGSVNIALTANAGMIVTGISTFSDNVILAEQKELRLEPSGAFKLYRGAGGGGATNFIKSTFGSISVEAANAFIAKVNSNEDAIAAYANDRVDLYYNNQIKFTTTNTGAVVTGIVTATSRVSLGNNTTNAVDLEFGTNRGSAGDTLANINWKWNNTYVAQIRGMAGSDTTNKDDAHLNFYTASAGSLVERVRIDSSGYLIAKADIRLRRTASNNGAIYFGDTNNNYIFGTDADDVITFATAGSERLRIDSSGKFCLGTYNANFASNDGIVSIVNAANSGTENTLLTLWNPNTTADARAGIDFLTNAQYGTGRDGAFIRGSNDGVTAKAHLQFGTIKDETYAETVRIGSSGQIGLGGANYGTSGQVLTSQGSSSAVQWATPASNSPAFQAHRSSTYTAANGSEFVLDFDQETFDTDSCYNFNNGRFTPTTSGYYIFYLNYYWSGTTSNNIKQAHTYIRKNGSDNLGQFWIDPHDSYRDNRLGMSVTCAASMNGSSDYVEAIGYCLINGGSPRFNAGGAVFGGFKLAI